MFQTDPMMPKRQGREIPLTPSDEQCSAWIQAFGAVLSLIAILFLQEWGEVHLQIYAVTLFCLYSYSAVYHFIPSIQKNPQWQLLAQSTHFLLLAGTYTPFASSLPSDMGTPLIMVVWALGILGAIFRAVLGNRVRVINVLITLSMVLLILFFAQPLLSVFILAQMQWMVLGGLSYVLAVFFKMMRKYPYSHSAWHLCSLFGAFFLFISAYMGL
ncbi:MAG: hemolysin III family protein [Spirochaetales bacterium]|nr:hemolysin III family protein [Spirochaetales bacterium]